jgi:predicted metal-dependent phosphoesterase TrpH
MTRINALSGFCFEKVNTTNRQFYPCTTIHIRIICGGMTRPFEIDSIAQYDLHMHTYWSYDATAEIRPYFERARALGLRCIAITEHHNIDSFGEIAKVAADFPDIRWIPSAELTVTTSFDSVDLLCYGLPLNPTGELAAVLEEYNTWQQAAGDRISKGMMAIGQPFDRNELLSLLHTFRPERVIARQGATHLPMNRLREYFIQRGYVRTPEEFIELNRRRAEVSAPNPYPAVERVVSAVKAAGGLVVIAHPQPYFQGANLKRMDRLREECALDGIECAHKSVSREMTDFYRQYCIQHGLLSTGGSDSHHSQHLAPDDSKPPQDRYFAHHIGKPEWLDEFLERLDSRTR